MVEKKIIHRPLDERNRVVIPPEIKDALNLDKGDVIIFKKRDGKVELKKGKISEE